MNDQVADKSGITLEMKQVPFTELCTLINLMDISLANGEMCFCFSFLKPRVNICFDITVMS